MAASYHLDAWGQYRFPTELNASANRFGFTGYLFDRETDLHYANARYYDGEHGRFTTQDAYLGTADTPPSLHRYVYANANPLRYVDPTGYAAEEAQVAESEPQGAPTQAAPSTQEEQVHPATVPNSQGAVVVQEQGALEKGSRDAGKPQNAAQAAAQQQAKQKASVATRQKTVFGVVVRGTGVSQESVDKAAEVVELTIGDNPEMQRRLTKNKVVVVVIPHNKKLTDLPEFKRLKGKMTAENPPRMWDDIRGVGGQPTDTGEFAVGVPEENLTGMPSDKYPAGYSVALHEFAHAIRTKGLSGKERKKSKQLYDARKKASGPWTDTYGGYNATEYFAQGTNAYFGRNTGMGSNGRSWLKKNDPELDKLLESIYEPKR